MATMTRSRSNATTSSSSNMIFALAAIAVAASLLIVTGVFWSSPSAIDHASEQQQQQQQDIITIQKGSVVGGTIPNSQAIAYYQCSSQSKTATPKDLVLLHGAHYTKEDWKTSGILHKFCSNDNNMRVTALDLPVTAKHDELISILDALVNKQMLQLPLVGIVTPSASGGTVLDGILSGNAKTLRQYSQRWIPVAALAALRYTVDQLMNAIDGWPILAIYGDQDKGGKRSSELLQRAAPSTVVVELPGSHPCYLDSPDAFVDTVMQYV